MMKKIRAGGWTVRAAALAAAALIAVCAAPASAVLPPKFGGELVVAIPDGISKYDPALFMYDHEFLAADLIYDTLLAPGPSGAPTPVLLDSMPVVSDDGMTFYFKLRPGVLFHNGAQLNSADVLHTFKSLISNRRSPYGRLLDGVAGAAEFRSGKQRGISGFKITDPLRFEVRLTERQPNFLRYLCFPALSIVSAANRDFSPPIGTGPFALVETTSRGDATLAANPKYFEGRPYLDKITLRVVKDDRDRLTEFKRGALDVSDVPAHGLSRAEREMYPPPLESEMKNIYFLDVNPDYPALAERAARSAASAAIDRQSIVRVILGGAGAEENNTGPAKHGSSAPRDAAIPLPLWYPDTSSALKLVAEKIQLNLGQAGFKATLRERGLADISQYATDDAPAFILRWMPVMMGLSESVETALYGPAGTLTRSTAIAGRLGADAKGQGTVIMLFSRKPAYLRQSSVYGAEAGPFGAPRIDSAYIRETD
ncbi:MAG TPA: ABC transporter substrate-binding protein [bacterium]|nr:ABC transporter substrate-binding protein [bacterium]